MGLTLKTSRGRNLEALIESSTRDVLLTRIPTSSKPVGKGRWVQLKSPVDFFGVYLPTRRPIAIDAKECANAARFPITDSTVKPHQRDMLIRYGEAGAISGLIVLCVPTRTIYFAPWQMLRHAPPSYLWTELEKVGTSLFALEWQKVADVANAMSVGMALALGGTPDAR